MLALQECEDGEALAELAGKFEFVGSAEATENRVLCICTFAEGLFSMP